MWVMVRLWVKNAWNVIFTPFGAVKVGWVLVKSRWSDGWPDHSRQMWAEHYIICLQSPSLRSWSQPNTLYCYLQSSAGAPSKEQVAESMSTPPSRAEQEMDRKRLPTSGWQSIRRSSIGVSIEHIKIFRQTEILYKTLLCLSSHYCSPVGKIMMVVSGYKGASYEGLSGAASELARKASSSSVSRSSGRRVKLRGTLWENEGNSMTTNESFVPNSW